MVELISNLRNLISVPQA